MHQSASPISNGAITRIVGVAPPDAVRLWMIQPVSVWERLRDQKTLFGELPEDDLEFQDSYDWMRDQMRRRLPAYGGHYPWWAYDYKLDLRSRHWYGPEQGVRLELALPAERVLLSAYGAWHCVLSHWYFPQAVEEADYEREDAAWDEELARHGLDAPRNGPLPEPWYSRMTASWQRIFDVDDLRDTNTIQACFECLNVEDVVKVTTFTSRPLSKRDQRCVSAR